MKRPEQSFPQEQYRAYYTPEDIFDIRQQIDKDIHQARESTPGFGKLVDSNYAASVVIGNQIKDRICKTYIEQFLNERKKFTSVFQTSTGSYYFVLQHGECWRFRQKKNEGFEPQVVSSRIVYVTETEAEEMLTELKKNPNDNSIFTNRRFFSSVHPTKDLVPLELGRCRVEEPIFEHPSPDTVRLVGVKNPKNGKSAIYNASNRFLSLSYHIGHGVDTIIYDPPKRT